MKTISVLNLLFLLAILTAAIISCQKDEGQIPGVTTAEDDAITDEMFDAVFLEIENATASMEDILFGGLKKSFEADTCKVVTIDIPGDTITWPKTITVDFGDGCPGLNGRVRKGKIIIVVSARVSSPSYSRTITFNDFYIDNYQIEGTKTIARAGKNDNNPLFTITLDDGKITSPEGKVITKEFSRTREWIEGYNTPRIRLDDEYLVTGSANGTDRNGEAYTRLISIPLHLRNNCPWIVSGSVIISRTGKEDIILDYGDETCNRIVTVTVGDRTTTITLPR